MQQFRSAVKRDIKTSNHDDDEGTFAYVGGVFCQSLVYFSLISLWKGRREMQTCFHWLMILQKLILQ
jgi:hypothetical protein